MSAISGTPNTYQRLSTGAATLADEHRKNGEHHLSETFAYGTRLVATSIFVPAAAVVFTIVFMLFAREQSLFPTVYSPLWGFLAAVVLWLLVSIVVLRGIAEPEHAIPSSYGELHRRLDNLEVALASVASGASPGADTTAYSEAAMQLAEMKDDLKTHGMQWALAQGYANIWGRLYKAEEALIDCAPIDLVLEGAYYDELRLDGSQIPNRDDLLAKLRRSVEMIDTNAARFLKTWTTPSTPSRLMIRRVSLPDVVVGDAYRVRLRASGGTPPYQWQSPDCPTGMMLTDEGILCGAFDAEGRQTFTTKVEDATGLEVSLPFSLMVHPRGTELPARPRCADTNAIARAALRSVRCSINEYRNALWNGLIVARNRLLATSTLMSILVFLLLAVAVIYGAKLEHVIAAAVFYLVGATIGVGKRLLDGTRTDSAVPDYGLSAARLTITPLFSGFCAVAGVVLVALLPLVNVLLPITPAAGENQQNQQALGANDKQPQPKTAPPAPAAGAPRPTLAAVTNPVTATSPTVAAAPAVTPESSTATSTAVASPDNTPKAPVVTETTVQLALGQQKNQADSGNVKESGAAEKALPRTQLAAITSLGNVFDLKLNLLGLFIAAMFGLTPSLLFSRIEEHTATFKKGLESTQATGRAASA